MGSLNELLTSLQTCAIAEESISWTDGCITSTKIVQETCTMLVHPTSPLVPFASLSYLPSRLHPSIRTVVDPTTVSVFSVVGSPRFGRVARPGQFPTRPVHCFPFVWWWHTTTPRPFGTTPRQRGLNPKHWVQDTSKMENTYDKWFQMADQVRARTLREGT